MNRDRVTEDAHGRKINFFLREHEQELWFFLFPLLQYELYFIYAIYTGNGKYY